MANTKQKKEIRRKEDNFARFAKLLREEAATATITLDLLKAIDLIATVAEKTGK